MKPQCWSQLNPICGKQCHGKKSDVFGERRVPQKQGLIYFCLGRKILVASILPWQFQHNIFLLEMLRISNVIFLKEIFFVKENKEFFEILEDIVVFTMFCIFKIN